MKKKILFLVALVAVILSFGYKVKGACTYDATFPSSYMKDMCNSVCSNAYPDHKDECINICKSSSNSDSVSTDKDCYCIKKQMNEQGDKCYRSRILTIMSKQSWGKSADLASSDMDNNIRKTAKQKACEAAAKKLSEQMGAYTAWQSTYNACLNSSSKCNTESSCASVICDLPSNKDNEFCKTGLTPTDYLKQKEAEKKNASYTYGAGNSGTQGSINEDLDYIAKITLTNCFGFGDIVYYTSLVIKILQIAAPILLIVWASIDLLKSMIAGDEKKIVEMRKPIIQRFIAAAAIFLVPWLVSTIVNNLSSNADWLVCWKNNRYSYSNGTNSGKKKVFVNSVHDQEKEKNYIKYACVVNCPSDIKDCEKTCMDTYWESRNTCYEQTGSDIEAARANCYKDFAQAVIKVLQEQKDKED